MVTGDGDSGVGDDDVDAGWGADWDLFYFLKPISAIISIMQSLQNWEMEQFNLKNENFA